MLSEEKLPNYTTLSEIVNSYKLWMEEYGDDKYDRYLDLTIRALVDLQLHHLRQVDVAYLTINSDLNTAQLPADCIDISLVGLNVNERIYILTENKYIAIPASESCGTEERDLDLSNGNIYFASHYHDGLYLDTLYGMTGGFEDVYYRRDLKNNRLILEGTIPANTSLLVEYISTGVGYNEQTIIPLYVKEALIARLRVFLAEADPRISQSEKMRLWALYGTEETKVKRIKHRFNLQQWISAEWRSQSRGVKR